MSECVECGVSPSFEDVDGTRTHTTTTHRHTAPPSALNTCHHATLLRVTSMMYTVSGSFIDPEAHSSSDRASNDRRSQPHSHPHIERQLHTHTSHTHTHTLLSQLSVRGYRLNEDDSSSTATLGEQESRHSTHCTHFGIVLSSHLHSSVDCHEAELNNLSIFTTKFFFWGTSLSLLSLFSLP